MPNSTNEANEPPTPSTDSVPPDYFQLPELTELLWGRVANVRLLKPCRGAEFNGTITMKYYCIMRKLIRLELNSQEIAQTRRWLARSSQESTYGVAKLPGWVMETTKRCVVGSSYQVRNCFVLDFGTKSLAKFFHSSVIFKCTFCFTSYSDPLIISFVCAPQKLTIPPCCLLSCQ